MKARHDELKAQRLALGLDPYLWACILNVSPSTIYRWESKSVGSLEPLHVETFERLKKVPRRSMLKLGRTLREFYLQNGSFYALGKLLIYLSGS